MSLFIQQRLLIEERPVVRSHAVQHGFEQLCAKLVARSLSNHVQERSGGSIGGLASQESVRRHTHPTVGCWGPAGDSLHRQVSGSHI